ELLNGNLLDVTSTHTATGVPVCLARWVTFREACSNAASALAERDLFSPVRRTIGLFLGDQPRRKVRGIVEPPAKKGVRRRSRKSGKNHYLVAIRVKQASITRLEDYFDPRGGQAGSGELGVGKLDDQRVAPCFDHVPGAAHGVLAC